MSLKTIPSQVNKPYTHLIHLGNWVESFFGLDSVCGQN